MEVDGKLRRHGVSHIIASACMGPFTLRLDIIFCLFPPQNVFHRIVHTWRHIFHVFFGCAAIISAHYPVLGGIVFYFIRAQNYEEMKRISKIGFRVHHQRPALVRRMWERERDAVVVHFVHHTFEVFQLRFLSPKLR